MHDIPHGPESPSLHSPIRSRLQAERLQALARRRYVPRVQDPSKPSEPYGIRDVDAHLAEYGRAGIRLVREDDHVGCVVEADVERPFRVMVQFLGRTGECPMFHVPAGLTAGDRVPAPARYRACDIFDGPGDTLKSFILVFADDRILARPPFAFPRTAGFCNPTH